MSLPGRRRFVTAASATAALALLHTIERRSGSARAESLRATLYDEVAAKVLPASFQSRISLADSIVRLVRYGVIDEAKFLSTLAGRGGIPPEFADVLRQPAREPIELTRENAAIYVNLLWPVGLANYMETNDDSPLKGDSTMNYASTGGWTLGKSENGGVYFNRLRIVDLNSGEVSMVTEVAKNTYRPCCDNSTFFQDCNHGSALMGLLQLGASQGLTEIDLYREALVFNSFWFPQNYVNTALYLKALRNIDWENVDPKLAMGIALSGGSGNAVVAEAVARIPGLLPTDPGRGFNRCGV